MPYGETQFRRDQQRYLSSRMQARNPAGYRRFLNYQSAREAAEAVAKEKPTPSAAPQPSPAPAAPQPSPAPAAPNPPPPPAPTPQSQPQGIGPSAYTQQFDHTKLAQDLKILGQQGGGIDIQGYKDLVSMGHSPYQLQEAVKEAATKGLRIGSDLESYFRSGIDPREQRAFEEERNTLYQQGIDQTMADADALRQQLADQSRRDTLAADKRAEADAEARRMQLIRERGAGRAQNLQIQGASSAPRGKGGSTGFRRRQDQFRISPYKGVGIGGGVIGGIAQGAANRMVNI